jgi:hypothetical protein
MVIGYPLASAPIFWFLPEWAKTLTDILVPLGKPWFWSFCMGIVQEPPVPVQAGHSIDFSAHPTSTE